MKSPGLRLSALLLILFAALLAGAGGLLLSLRINGPGPFTAVLIRSDAGLWLLEHVISPPPAASSQVGAVGENVADLQLHDLDGKPHRLGDWHGRILIVNVWASWCEPCRREMPLLAAFAARQGPSGAQVVGIAQDELPAIRSYLQQTPVNYPILVGDVHGGASLRLGNRLGGLPYTVLIGSDGTLLRRKLGPFASANELQAWAVAHQ